MEILRSRKDIVKATLNNQISRLRSILKAYGFDPKAPEDETEDNIKEILAEPMNFGKKIEVLKHDIKSNAMHYDLMMYFARHFDIEPKAWELLRNGISKEIKDQYDTNEPNAKEQAAYVPWEDMIKIRDAIADERVKLLVLMYTEIPPQRNDFAEVHIFQDPPKDIPKNNYIVLGSKALHMVSYKTDDTYGARVIPLPDSIMNIISDGRKLLFTKKDGTVYLPRSFGAWANKELRKVFNKPVTLTSFRHWWASNEKNQTLADLKHNAKEMGHSVETHMQYMKLYDTESAH